MIQDNDNQVLSRTNCTPITPQLIEKEGFERLTVKRNEYSSIIRVYYIHKELDIKLTQYDISNQVVKESGYPYCYTMKFELPVPVNESEVFEANGRSMGTFSYSIYTIGQLKAVMEAKRQLDVLKGYIRGEVDKIKSAVLESNKFKS